MNIEVLPGRFTIYNHSSVWFLKLDEGFTFGPFNTYAESMKKARSLLINADDAF